MSLGGSTKPDQTARHGSLAERNALASGFRRWGMQYTVYNDGANDGTYYLKYNNTSTSLTDNANWVLPSTVLGSWIPSLTTGDTTAVQNTATSDITGQIGTKTFCGLHWNVVETARTSTGVTNFLQFQKNGSDVFKVDLSGGVVLKRGSLNAPSLSFEGNLASGIYGNKHGSVRISAKGVLSAQFLSTGILPGSSGLRDLGHLSNNWRDIFMIGNLIIGSSSAINDGSVDLITHDGEGNVTIANGTLTTSKYQRLTEVTAPASTPAAGTMYLYADSADSKLKYKNDAGNIIEVGRAIFNIEGTDLATRLFNATAKTSIDFWTLTRLEATSASTGGYFQGMGGFREKYPNKTAMVTQLEIIGIKSDGTVSVIARRKGRMRKDNGGTWTVDEQKGLYTSDSTIIASAGLKINGGFPGIEFGTGASGANYAILRTLKVTAITY